VSEARQSIVDADEARQCLLTEYQLLIDLYRHEDDMMVRRSNLFLLISAGLLTVLFGLVGGGPGDAAPTTSLRLAEFLIATMGLACATAWMLIARNTAAWLWMRAIRLRTVEQELGTPRIFRTEDEVSAGVVPVDVPAHMLPAPGRFTLWCDGNRCVYILATVLLALWVVVMVLWSLNRI